MASSASLIPPTPPANLTFIPSDATPGEYVVGHDVFRVKQIPLTSIFHRELTSVDDFLLGVLSIIFIAVFSDLLYTLLLRTTHGHVSPLGLLSAFLVNEATHLRNVARHLRRSLRTASARKIALSPGLLSAVVLLAVVIPLVADVVVIVVTQPRVYNSAPDEYNLRAYQPVVSSERIGRNVVRLMRMRRCVNPVYTNRSSTQARRFIVQTCFDSERKTKGVVRGRRPLLNDGDRPGAGAGRPPRPGDPPSGRGPPGRGPPGRRPPGGRTAVRQSESITMPPPVPGNNPEDVSGDIVITSAYHIAGSDHNVSFASGWFSAEVRLQILLNTDTAESGQLKHVLFTSLDDGELSHARYLHALLVHRAKASACARNRAWCAAQAGRPTTPTSSRFVNRTVALWRKRTRGLAKLSARGVESTFAAADIPDALNSVRSAMPTLFASAVVREERRPGAYVDVSTQRRLAGMEGLLTEQGRAVGLVLMGTLVAAGLALMFAMRLVLKPVSLGELAASVAGVNPDVQDKVSAWRSKAQVDDGEFEAPGGAMPHDSRSQMELGMSELEQKILSTASSYMVK